MKATQRTIEERKVEAEHKSAKYLADANKAAEKGDVTKAEKLYGWAEAWLWKYNKLSGNG